MFLWVYKARDRDTECLRLEVVAVNISLCENIGTAVVCARSAENVHGGRTVLGVSQPFNVYKVSRLLVLEQPRSAPAAR